MWKRWSLAGFSLGDSRCYPTNVIYPFIFFPSPGNLEKVKFHCTFQLFVIIIPILNCINDVLVRKKPLPHLITSFWFFTSYPSSYVVQWKLIYVVNSKDKMFWWKKEDITILLFIARYDNFIFSRFITPRHLTISSICATSLFQTIRHSYVLVWQFWGDGWNSFVNFFE